MIIRLIIFIVSCILGTLLHFTYNLSKKNKFVGLFSATNESTFEHTKIALFGRIITIPIEVHYLGSNPNYYLSLLVELVTISILISLFYYGYKKFTKKDITWINISIFYITLFISNIIGSYILLGEPNIFLNKHAPVGIIIIIILLIAYSIYPLKNIIFKDPLKKR